MGGAGLQAGRCRAVGPPLAAHLGDDAVLLGEGVESRLELLAPLIHVIYDVALLERVEHGVACRRGERVAAVGARVVSGLEDVRAALAQHGADGHAAAERLGSREDVGLDLVRGRVRVRVRVGVRVGVRIGVRVGVRVRVGVSEDVGLDLELLVAPHLARAAHARLDLVADEQRARLVAQLARRSEELLRRRRDAALALQ